MTTIVCTLRSGGDFDTRHVRALREGVRRHLIAPHRFACLTDMEVDVDGVETLPLAHGWPGWWSKLETLNPALWPEGERVVLMDLDTLPVGNLYRLAILPTDWAMLKALNPRRAKAGKMVSGIVVFRAGEDTESARLYRMFADDPEKWMDEFRGDGEFLAANSTPDGIQDHVPGIVSAKWDIGYGSDGPDDSVTLALGHGLPRFSEPSAGWAHELWSERAAPEAKEEAA